MKHLITILLLTLSVSSCQAEEVIVSKTATVLSYDEMEEAEKDLPWEYAVKELTMSYQNIIETNPSIVVHHTDGRSIDIYGGDSEKINFNDLEKEHLVMLLECVGSNGRREYCDKFIDEYLKWEETK